MTTIALWLLTSMGSLSYGGTVPSVVERFTTQQDCESFKKTLIALDKYQPQMHCIEAKVYKP